MMIVEKRKDGNRAHKLMRHASVALTRASRKPSTANKLNQEQKRIVYQMLAAGYKPVTVCKYIKLITGIEVSRQNVQQMRQTQPEKVEQGRREIEKEIRLAAPLASKVARLAKRQELVNSLERQMWRVTSMTKTGLRIVTGSHEVINRILDSMKAELEPYEVNVSLDIRQQTAQQYQDVTDSGVITEAMNRLKAAGMEITKVIPKKE